MPARPRCAQILRTASQGPLYSRCSDGCVCSPAGTRTHQRTHGQKKKGGGHSQLPHYTNRVTIGVGVVVTHGYECAPQVRSQTRLQYRRTRPTRRAAWGSRFCPQVPQRTRVDRDSAGRKCALHIRARQIGSKRRLRCLGVELGFPVYQISIWKQGAQ